MAKVVVVLSDDELEAVRAKAGLVPLSAWFRALALGAGKPAKRAVAVEVLRASDPMASERPDIEYGSSELPSGGSVLDANSTLKTNSQRLSVGKASVETWRAGRKPIPKPGGKGR